MASNESNEIPTNVAQILKELSAFADPNTLKGSGPSEERNQSLIPSVAPIETQTPAPTKYTNSHLEEPLQEPAGINQDLVNLKTRLNRPSRDVGSGLNEHLLKLQEITEAARKKADEGRKGSNSKDNSTAKSAVSPSSIIEWGQALRHVSRLATQDPYLETVIRKMIRDQLSNEETWWKQRESLRKVIEQGQASKLELSKYDAKIYKAQVDMNSHMSRELRNLGIPFFEMPPSLVVDSEKAPEGKVTVSQLRVLQTKMIDYLQSMYGPD